MNSWLRALRKKLAHVDSTPQLALLGLISGVLSGALVIMFRLAIELPQFFFMPGGTIDDYESLHWIIRIALPILGAAIIAIAFIWIRPHSQKVGVVHVIDRFANHQGWMDLRNGIVQFWAGALSALSGHSVGREGPAVHLGAASSSLMARSLGLPNNSIRILVGCGVAAAISASFNTPIAGVVFAMEVVMMEYSISTFTPIILASVSGAVLSRAVFGHEAAFIVPQLQLGSLYEIPFIILLGIILGTLAAAFVFFTTWIFEKSKPIAPWLRLLGAGVIMSSLGLLVPQVMGIGYDTVNSALSGQIAIWLLFLIGITKLVASSTSIGLGIPGGLIGPTLVIGSCIGGAFGLFGYSYFPEYSASPGFYSMLGMAGMMSAVLHAPLSALMALLELTGNPNIILPGMLVVIIANLVCTEVFKQNSIFMTLLKAQGLDYRFDPLSQALYKVGVQSAMDRRFIRHGHEITYRDAHVLMENSPHWLLVDKGDKPVALMPMADLARFIKSKDELPVEERPEEDETFNVLSIPADRKDLTEIELYSSLKEAYDLLNEKKVEAVYVKRMTAPMINRIYGVLTRKDIERYYNQ